MPKGFVYILECSDGSYYTGSTIDLALRFCQHQGGKGSNHTKKRLPVKLVYAKEFQRIDEAFYREKQIQGWSRNKKEALIERSFEKLPALAECKNETHSNNKDVTSTPLSHQKTTPLSHQSVKLDNSSDLDSIQPSMENSFVDGSGSLVTEQSKSVAERSHSVAERSHSVAERSRSYSNGKLLLTSEYLVLDGAKSLAIPTKFGQDLIVEKIKEPSLIWESFDIDKNCWFSAEFRLSDLRIVSETFNANSEDSKESIAQTLQNILEEARRMNPNFLNSDGGFLVKTNLTFPRNWGLGTSSTLINNIAQWAKVDAFALLQNSFGGSGYDIACAQNDFPIRYQLVTERSRSQQKRMPKVEVVEFNPSFADKLFFVHLNIKQDSKKGIERYKEKRGNINNEITRISEITEAMINCTIITEFEKLIVEHEQIISNIIQNKPIKEILFADYFGAIKSLGAWGGDFVLVTGNERTPEYFKEKGFETVISYKDMVL